MTDDLDRCTVCYAYVEMTGRHRTWHQEQDRKLKKLEGAVANLEARLRR